MDSLLGLLLMIILTVYGFGEIYDEMERKQEQRQRKQFFEETGKRLPLKRKNNFKK